MQKTQISSDVALIELTKFLKIHKAKDFRRGKMTDEMIKEDYIDVLEAIEDGLMVFDEKSKPVYKLRFPLDTDKQDSALAITEVTFKSRIKGADKTMLLDGIDPKKQLGTYMLKVISYITQLDQVDAKRLEVDDFEVLNQICSVF